jgi:flagellar basal body-associated protein FliL
MTDETDHAEAQHPAPKKKKRKSHIATWIALASAFAAIIAAAVSALSVNVAKEQNVAAEQQQLVSITTFIAQQYAGQESAENQAAGDLTGNARTVAISDADLDIAVELNADAQAAAVVITGLHGDGVAGIEYIEVARALDSASDTSLSLIYYNDAVNAPPHDVPTRANALRQEAAIYYSLGQNVIAHQDMIQAAKVFSSGHLELTRSYIDNSIAQAYLGDAGYQTQINCQNAAIDMRDAENAIAPLGTNGANVTIQALEGIDLAAYQKKCTLWMPIGHRRPPSCPQ